MAERNGDPGLQLSSTREDHLPGTDGPIDGSRLLQQAVFMRAARSDDGADAAEAGDMAASSGLSSQGIVCIQCMTPLASCAMRTQHEPASLFVNLFTVVA